MSSCEEVKVIDDVTKLTIPDLISYLEGKFRPAEFDKVKRALLNREETMALENHKLQQNLEDSLLARLLLEDESKEKKREIEELTERNLKLAEENRVVNYENGVLKEREKRGEERYEKVKGELKRLEEEGGKGKVLELQNRVRDLEIEKGNVEGKLEAWRERYGRITSRVLLLEGQVNVLKAAVEMADEVGREREKEKPSSADSGCGNGNLAGGATGGSNRHGDLKIGGKFCYLILVYRVVKCHIVITISIT